MTTNRTAAPLLTLSALALAVGLLTGCSTTSDAAPTAAPAVTAPAPASDAVSTPVVPAVPAVGASITSDEDVAAAEAAGLGVFDVFDDGGTWTNAIVFDPAAPLPDPIKAAIAAPVNAANAAAAATGVSGDTWTDAQNAAVKTVSVEAAAAAKSASKKAGRNVVIVYSRYGSLDGSNFGTVWAATAADTMVPDSGSASADGAAAVAQAWIATQPDSASFEIVIAG